MTRRHFLQLSCLFFVFFLFRNERTRERNNDDHKNKRFDVAFSSTQRPKLRVVLMSATLRADTFAAYFGESTPRLKIGSSMYPVQTFYLEDALKQTNFLELRDGSSNWVSTGLMMVKVVAINKADF